MTRLANVSVGGTITAADTNAARQMVNKTMQLMTPTSVSTGSIGTYGAVSFSGASAISINGCFTSEFDWYTIKFDVTTSGSAVLRAKLRLSGTDATGAYDNQRDGLINTTTSLTQNLNNDEIVLIYSGVTGRQSGTVDLFGPALASSTTGMVFAGAAANPMTSTSGLIHKSFFSHRTTTAYDGISVIPSTGTITGSIRVYGII